MIRVDIDINDIWRRDVHFLGPPAGLIIRDLFSCPAPTPLGPQAPYLDEILP
jgi:hypothetical protein